MAGRLEQFMPQILTTCLTIDYTDDGTGESVVLIHSSVSGNRQWRTLSDKLKRRYRVLAINLFGYGETTPWPPASQQSLADQAQLVSTLCDGIGHPVHLVGHSFGGAVALKSAMLMGSDVASLVLLEPIPIYLLRQAGRVAAFDELSALRDDIRRLGSADNWGEAARRFADYWMGAGSWTAMPEGRRDAFIRSLRPNLYEWDAVMNEETTIEAVTALDPRTLVVSAASTQEPIRELVELLSQACPKWTFRSIREGGHMAPITHPHIVDSIIEKFLEAGSAEIWDAGSGSRESFGVLGAASRCR
jgi:pimeloyl-ACP methyl ester carboxylesterase